MTSRSVIVTGRFSLATQGLSLATQALRHRDGALLPLTDRLVNVRGCSSLLADRPERPGRGVHDTQTGSIGDRSRLSLLTILSLCERKPGPLATETKR
jgi:hypothetical protein